MHLLFFPISLSSPFRRTINSTRAYKTSIFFFPLHFSLFATKMSKDSTTAENFNFGDFLGKSLNEQISFFNSPVSKSQSTNGRESEEISEIFSDEVLDYINQMLMEEDKEEKSDMLESHPDFEATLKPFYELIGQKYPPSPDRSHLKRISRNSTVFTSGIDFVPSNSEFQEEQISDLFLRNLPASEFEKGLEEAKKFLPEENKLLINVGEANLTLQKEPIERARGKQNRRSDESETRRRKQLAFSSEDQVVPTEAFDEILLCSSDKFPQMVKTIRENIFEEPTNNSKNAKKQAKEEEADINTLLLHCAQTVAAGDKPKAHELLKQIRQYSSPYGEASQRISHYFADGLEARLAGTGSEIYDSHVFKRKSAKDLLHAYQIYIACCPFEKIFHYFAHETILHTIRNASRVHILDFGIYFGFQWPVFLKLLSSRPGGPPKLRITGIDFPQPGFRPREMIEGTGRRLRDYAERFGVPFEYHGVAAKFDEIDVKDFRIDEEEMLVVNCLFRLHRAADETAFEDCPRDKVLNTIRKLKPAVFVNVVVNGTYGASIFMTRIREALYHFSAMFDMINETTPRESERRLLLERDLYGQMLINAISCEGLERERPETYKKWQVRCLRAGFEMVPSSKEFVKKVKGAVRSIYHRDFTMDEDGRWLLVGWKGRILYGLSAWKPSCS